MEEFCGVVINGRRLVVNKNGDVYGLKADGQMKIIDNVANNKTGYNRIGCGIGTDFGVHNDPCGGAAH